MHAAQTTIALREEMTQCSWWPNVKPVSYGFRYSLTIIKRQPKRIIVCADAQFCSERELLASLDLLGREGYDFIYRTRSSITMLLSCDTAEEKARLQALGTRILSTPALKPLRNCLS
jgi:hypothetical protein